jgi:hypothetical protein
MIEKKNLVIPVARQHLTQIHGTIDEWREKSMRPLHDYEKSLGSFDDEEDDSSSA